MYYPQYTADEPNLIVYKLMVYWIIPMKYIIVYSLFLCIFIFFCCKVWNPLSTQKLSWNYDFKNYNIVKVQCYGMFNKRY